MNQEEKLTSTLLTLCYDLGRVIALI
jgi:hypothetical protein